MKNIFLIILTFFTLNLFGQGAANEFRTATGTLKSVKGTNFKKGTMVIGGKNVPTYQQPNTDTYNTFSVINDSVRIQKWTLDTSTNVFISSNLNDVYLDNLVNKPSVDSRVVLSVVNDSLKVEVWDIINNSIISTYYIDDAINHPETVTHITNTLVTGHPIGDYKNEIGLTEVIKESVIQLDSITNGYQLTKEDGTKDTIKINPSSFYTLTTVDDTLALLPEVQSKCPALSIAKLDSCNVAYLYMFNCNTASWENFKVETREYKDKEFLITQKYKNFIDNTGVANTTNPAYKRQLESAKMGCDHCPYPSIMDAVIYAQTNSVDTLDVELSAETYKETGTSTNPVFGNFSSFKLNTRNSFLDVSNSNQPLFSVNSDTKNDYTLNIDNLVGINCTHTPYPIFSSRHEGTGTLNLNINNLFFEPTQSTRLFGAFLETKGNLNFTAENVHYKAGSFFLTSNGGEVNLRNISKTYKVKNLELIDGTGLYIRRGQHDTKINAQFENVTHYKTGNVSQILGTSVSNTNLISKLGGGSFAVINGNNSSVYFRCNNYIRTDTLTDNFGIGSFDNASTLGFGGHNYSNSVVHFGQVIDEDSLHYFFELDNVKTNDEIFVVDGSRYSTNPTIYNSTINIIVKNGITKARAINISNLNLVNSSIIVEGAFEAKNKCVTIYNNNLDATSSITLKGKFKTTSPTLEAMEIGNNSGAGVNNIIINGQIITGGGYSIDNPSGTPISVKVMPGCASNVTTSPNVTQLGTGIYVDPNFNN